MLVLHRRCGISVRHFPVPREWSEGIPGKKPPWGKDCSRARLFCWHGGTEVYSQSRVVASEAIVAVAFAFLTKDWYRPTCATAEFMFAKDWLVDQADLACRAR